MNNGIGNALVVIAIAAPVLAAAFLIVGHNREPSAEVHQDGMQPPTEGIRIPVPDGPYFDDADTASRWLEAQAVALRSVESRCGAIVAQDLRDHGFYAEAMDRMHACVRAVPEMAAAHHANGTVLEWYDAAAHRLATMEEEVRDALHANGPAGNEELPWHASATLMWIGATNSASHYAAEYADDPTESIAEHLFVNTAAAEQNLQDLQDMLEVVASHPRTPCALDHRALQASFEADLSLARSHIDAAAPTDDPEFWEDQAGWLRFILTEVSNVTMAEGFWPALAWLHGDLEVRLKHMDVATGVVVPPGDHELARAITDVWTAGRSMRTDDLLAPAVSEGAFELPAEDDFERDHLIAGFLVFVDQADPFAQLTCSGAAAPQSG